MKENIFESKIYKIVNEVFEKNKASILTEAFQSNILKQVFDKNHVREYLPTRPHSNFLSDIHFNNMWRDLSHITDDMIDGVYNSPQEAGVNNKTPYMKFKNGVTIVFNDKIRELDEPSEERFNQRFNSQSQDKFYKENYRSRNQAFNNYKDTYKMWNNDIKNGDKPYFDGDQETRHNSTPSVVKNSFYQRAKDFYKK